MCLGGYTIFFTPGLTFGDRPVEKNSKNVDYLAFEAAIMDFSLRFSSLCVTKSTKSAADDWSKWKV